MDGLFHLPRQSFFDLLWASGLLAQKEVHCPRMRLRHGSRAWLCLSRSGVASTVRQQGLRLQTLENFCNLALEPWDNRFPRQLSVRLQFGDSTISTVDL